MTVHVDYHQHVYADIVAILRQKYLTISRVVARLKHNLYSSFQSKKSEKKPLNL